jgi:hypothetical protein
MTSIYGRGEIFFAASAGFDRVHFKVDNVPPMHDPLIQELRIVCFYWPVTPLKAWYPLSQIHRIGLLARTEWRMHPSSGLTTDERFLDRCKQ